MLTRFGQGSITQAELAGTHATGQLYSFDGSPCVWQIDAGIESVYRFSPRTVLCGSIAYQNFSGDDMTGSYFIPATSSSLSPLSSFLSPLSTTLSPLSSFLSPLTTPHRPFDLMEDSLATAGRKHLDVYRLSGGFGTQISRRLAVGARLDYTAANYAKYRDLRHQNKQADLKASVSVYAPLAQWFSVGAYYLYHRNIESISFSTYGKEGKTHVSLIDYGAFFGLKEQFGYQGCTDKSREMPLVDERHGGGLQVEVRPVEALTAYADLALDYRSGYYGRKSPYTITYTQHNGHQTTLNARLTLSLAATRHSLGLTYATEKLQNRAETYRELPSASGAIHYEYYDPVETADKRWTEGTVAYTLDLGLNGQQPVWTLQAGINWMDRRQTAYLYPYYRYQHLSNYEPYAAVSRHLDTRHGLWSLSLSGSFLSGSGQPYTDYTAPCTPLPSAEPSALLTREYRYLTATQYAVGCQARYAFHLPQIKLMPYLRVALRHRWAPASEGIERRSRTQATMAVGCSF